MLLGRTCVELEGPVTFKPQKRTLRTTAGVASPGVSQILLNAFKEKECSDLCTVGSLTLERLRCTFYRRTSIRQGAVWCGCGTAEWRCMVSTHQRRLKSTYIPLKPGNRSVNWGLDLLRHIANLLQLSFSPLDFGEVERPSSLATRVGHKKS